MGSSDRRGHRALRPVQEDRYLKLWSLVSQRPSLHSPPSSWVSSLLRWSCCILDDGRHARSSFDRKNWDHQDLRRQPAANFYARVAPSHNLTRIIPGSVSCPGQWSVVSTDNFLKIDLFSDNCIHRHMAWHSAHIYVPSVVWYHPPVFTSLPVSEPSTSYLLGLCFCL